VRNVGCPPLDRRPAIRRRSRVKRTGLTRAVGDVGVSGRKQAAYSSGVGISPNLLAISPLTKEQRSAIIRIRQDSTETSKTLRHAPAAAVLRQRATMVPVRSSAVVERPSSRELAVGGGGTDEGEFSRHEARAEAVAIGTG
jgi:hypothetical protein